MKLDLYTALVHVNYGKELDILQSGVRMYSFELD